MTHVAELMQNSRGITRLLVGRPGLDPDTLGMKETFNLFRGVGLGAHVDCFQGIVLFCVGLVTRCCRNMRPKKKPFLGYRSEDKRAVQQAYFHRVLLDWMRDDECREDHRRVG